MGVSGCGKTTVGTRLAEQVGGTFLDADDFHPPANLEKMSSGVPLDDADRAPWLEQLRSRIDAHDPLEPPVILACSALKRAYRDTLRGSEGKLAFIHLHGSHALLAERLADRATEGEHFMPASLLDSQWASLEAPEAEPLTWTLDIAQPPAVLAAQAARLLGW